MKKQHNYTCESGDCPAASEALRKIVLTPDEKKAIFLGLQAAIEHEEETRKKITEAVF